MNTVEPIRSKLKIAAMKNYLKGKSARDYLLFCFMLNTALRVGDCLRTKLCDVVDDSGEVRKVLRVREQKTGKEVRIELNDQVRGPLNYYFKHSRPLELDQFLFTAKRSQNPISRIRVHQILKKAAKAVGIEAPISCHSARKSYGYHKRQEGWPIELIQARLGHASPSVTRRYIGISADEVAQLDKTGI